MILCIYCGVELTSTIKKCFRLVFRVSYVKAVDAWMFTCIAFIFAAFLEYPLVNVLQRRKTQKVPDIKHSLREVVMNMTQTLPKTTSVALHEKVNVSHEFVMIIICDDALVQCRYLLISCVEGLEE